ncbi:tripartite tricarboxylate transporter substrate binding protein [Cereibacter sphaeroides]|nr:tripartite tricarboxylate transporter substrate binding protein [Cereibacter sphaeroides]
MTILSLSRRHFAALGASAAVLAALPLAGHAQSWPNGSVQLIVPARAGGGTDAIARVVGAAMQDALGAPVVVVNNAGGSGAVAAEQVRTARPDGQTLFFGNSGLFAVYQTGGYQYDPTGDFTSIAALTSPVTYSVVVAADSEYQSVADVVADAEARPNQVVFGIQPRGTTHFMAGLLQQDTGVQFRLVDAGTDADKWVQLQGGQIDVTLTNSPGTIQYVEAGAVRILGTIGGEPGRDPILPDVPSLVEAGYPNATLPVDLIVLGPEGMDPAVVTAINAALAEAAQDPTVIERLTQMNTSVTALSVEDSTSRMADTNARIGETATALGLR